MAVSREAFFPLLAEMESKGEIKVVGAMYDIKTGAMEFFG